MRRCTTLGRWPTIEVGRTVPPLPWPWPWCFGFCVGGRWRWAAINRAKRSLALHCLDEHDISIGDYFLLSTILVLLYLYAVNIASFPLSRDFPNSPHFFYYTINMLQHHNKILPYKIALYRTSPSQTFTFTFTLLPHYHYSYTHRIASDS